MAQLADVVHLVEHVLGPNVLGAYQYGSAVLRGGLRPYSDLDVLVVTGRSLGAEERRALVDGLLGGVSAPPEGQRELRPVELTVVVESDVRPWQYPPRCDFQYGEWCREHYERGEVPQPGSDEDVAVLLAMALAADTALAGPPPRCLLDPVPWRDVRRASLAAVEPLRAEAAEDTRNAVLTLARVHATLSTDRFRSKAEGASWTLGRLPQQYRPILAQALAVYEGEAEEPAAWPAAELDAYVAHMAAEITRLAEGD
ncbi:aminoglycoside adenylyltransferase family protein [Streptomyces sulphureus]|uniref:aminoglycoside adenylyltransferase family protein n=1 Tax=Streptomyces sulphureus TaxID=47758 RepID=UPI00036F1E7A|nr:aminoglycoside adenylyltransferase family protein [Streptomyces sulphureus]